MAGQEKLYKAVIDKLRADTGAGSLVTLTGHTAAEPHIARQFPKVRERTPFLAVWVARSLPLIGADATAVQNAVVDFVAYDKDELTAIRIADRVEELLHAKTLDANLGYWNPSNSTVSVRQTRFMERRGPDFDQETDTYDVLVEAALVWVGQPCPAAP